MGREVSKNADWDMISRCVYSMDEVVGWIHVMVCSPEVKSNSQADPPMSAFAASPIV